MFVKHSKTGKMLRMAEIIVCRTDKKTAERVFEDWTPKPYESWRLVGMDEENSDLDFKYRVIATNRHLARISASLIKKEVCFDIYT